MSLSPHPLHPYLQTHFALANGTMPSALCEALAIVTTTDPSKVTCPKCQESLQRLARLLEQLLETLDDDTVSA